MTLPNFLIVGTAKAGTTSLAAYLDRHPDVCFARVHEPNFFAYDEQYARGEAYYRSLFAHYAGESRIGEKSWRYACSEVYPEAFGRLTAMLPELKILYVVRDPLTRATSMWRELRDAGQDIVSPDPETALLGDPLILDSMRYHSTYRRFSAHFGDENTRLLFFEDLLDDPKAFYRDVTDFLEIGPYDPGEVIHENRSQGQRSDTAVLEWLRRRSWDRTLRNAAPERVRALARRVLKRTIEDIEISPDAREAFLTMVEPEARAVLDLVDRPRAGWTLR